MNKKRFKRIGEEIYVLYNGMYILFKEAPSSRLKSWITLDQISLEYPEFLDQIAEILFSGEYGKRPKEFVRSILYFLELDRFISWAQFDSIFRICTTYKDYLEKVKSGTFMRQQGRLVSIKRNSVTLTHMSPRPISLDALSTDRAVDRFCENILGYPCMFEEELEGGMSRAYRSDGSRYFTYTTDEDILDGFPTYPFP